MKKIFTDIPHQIKEIARILNVEGFQCFLVGGAVRDSIMGITPHEYDITTDARPEDVQRIFKYTIPTGIKHGTILVIIDDMHVEITTFRSDGNYTDGRHPDNVEYASNIEEDLPRRDLTINAMAYNVLDGTLIDMFDGMKDIKRKIVKSVGNPYERFREDGLRIMRAIRFSTKLNFDIEKETFEAITHSTGMLASIAAERIREEFNGILLSKNPFRGLELLRKTGVLSLILPELMQGFGVTQNKFHKYDVYYHILHTVQEVEPLETEELTLLVRLAALFHDIAKPMVQKKVSKQDDPVYYNHEVVGSNVAKKIMKRLKYSNSEIDFVTLLVRQHMFYYQDEWTDGAVRRFMRAIGVENIKPLLKLREADRLGSGHRKDKESKAIPKLLSRIDKIIEEENAITVKDLKIDGNDLINEFNLKPSPLIGKILNYLLDLILDEPDLNNREFLIEKTKSFLDSNNIKNGA
ncbi:CCA tRNA nucleotidyltransferase [Brachyspira sp.]|uniref:CCA tRNA nucleotidyltransferase n=1 Tax=Brachyspira sp. TaxID=1977261 RepID=UPI0026123727|nr:CCA tRNA nucleotidyltransferase [Brachyspira sp.]